jgi:hypothetical protein
VQCARIDGSVYAYSSVVVYGFATEIPERGFDPAISSGERNSVRGRIERESTIDIVRPVDLSNTGGKLVRSESKNTVRIVFAVNPVLVEVLLSAYEYGRSSSGIAADMVPE